MKLSIFLLALVLAACGGEASDSSSASQVPPSDLTAEQMEHGVGPVTAFDPGPIDPALADHGKEIFTTKCSACHKLDERYVGPSLGGVTTRRTPAYIMNMVLNSEEMILKHPEAKALLVEFMTPMPNQHLTEDEARAVLDYLRQQAPAE